MIISGQKVAAAWVAARAAIGGTVAKDGKANYGKYATLAAVMDIITPALAANKLAIVQEAELNDSAVTVAATLLHESGETIEFVPLTMPMAQRTAQAVGSAITYARRYQLVGLFGLAPDDDDGEAAQPAHAAKSATASAPARTAQHTAPTPNGAQRPPESPTEASAQAVQDNPFDDLSPLARKLVAGWQSPADAYAWAIAEGACQNEFEAKNSLKKIVDRDFGGKLTKANMRDALLAFYLRQEEKLSELFDAAEAEAAQAELAAA